MTTAGQITGQTTGSDPSCMTRTCGRFSTQSLCSSTTLYKVLFVVGTAMAVVSIMALLSNAIADPSFSTIKDITTSGGAFFGTDGMTFSVFIFSLSASAGVGGAIGWYVMSHRPAKDEKASPSKAAPAKPPAPPTLAEVTQQRDSARAEAAALRTQAAALSQAKVDATNIALVVEVTKQRDCAREEAMALRNQAALLQAQVDATNKALAQTASATALQSGQVTKDKNDALAQVTDLEDRVRTLQIEKTRLEAASANFASLHANATATPSGSETSASVPRVTVGYLRRSGSSHRRGSLTSGVTTRLPRSRGSNGFGSASGFSASGSAGAGLGSAAASPSSGPNVPPPTTDWTTFNFSNFQTATATAVASTSGASLSVSSSPSSLMPSAPPSTPSPIAASAPSGAETLPVISSAEATPDDLILSRTASPLSPPPEATASAPTIALPVAAGAPGGAAIIPVITSADTTSDALSPAGAASPLAPLPEATASAPAIAAPPVVDGAPSASSGSKTTTFRPVF